MLLKFLCTWVLRSNRQKSVYRIAALVQNHLTVLGILNFRIHKVFAVYIWIHNELNQHQVLLVNLLVAAMPWAQCAIPNDFCEKEFTVLGCPFLCNAHMYSSLQSGFRCFNACWEFLCAFPIHFSGRMKSMHASPVSSRATSIEVNREGQVCWTTFGALDWGTFVGKRWDWEKWSIIHHSQYHFPWQSETHKR